MVDDPYDSSDDSAVDDNNIWYINSLRSIYIHTILMRISEFNNE